MQLNIEKIVWRGPKGEVIACTEKNKVMRENLEELRQMAQDALEDAVLMGCDEEQVRNTLAELMLSLINPYPPRE
jgi:UDP-N-acetylmuramoylalanine-D-glutamate ligase